MRYLLLLSCLAVHNIQSMIVLPSDKTELFTIFNSKEEYILFEKNQWRKTEKLFDTDAPRSASKQVILTNLEVVHKIITIDGLLHHPPALQVKRKSNLSNKTSIALAKLFEHKKNTITLNGKKFRVSNSGITFSGKQKIQETRQFVQQDTWFRKKIFYVKQSINPDDHKVTYTLKNEYHRLTLLSVGVLAGSAALGLVLLIEQLKQQFESDE